MSWAEGGSVASLYGSEIIIKLDKESMCELHRLTRALEGFERKGIPGVTTAEQLLMEHVHCGHCGREASGWYRIVECGGEIQRELAYKCQGCGCIGSRDDRGQCGTIRWG
jgi:hypothetical protein